jgi:hypothetical protein
MKKLLVLTGIITLLVLIGGCGKDKQGGEDITNTPTPTVRPTATLPAQQDTQDNTAEEALTVKDYYPLIADAEYVYDGEGNEFAPYNRYTDFLDTAGNRLQTRTANGGTETVRVLEIKDGRLSVIKTVNECYYRDNFLEEAAADDQAEVLLMEPLVQGTEWTLPNGSKRYISSTGVEVDTPSGTYQAIEVTTQYSDSTTKDYYSPQVGLVKSVFNSGDMQVFSVLREIKTDTPFTQTINIYYPDSDWKLHAEALTLSFRTGDITRLVFEDALKKKASEESYLPLASTNTKINSLYLGEDEIVHADFSPELVTEMNAGAGYELTILQCITNTLGNYYGTDQVSITVDGKPYESGHILMKEGETFRVDMENVIE